MSDAGTPSPSIVESQLEHILSSAEFHRSERMCRFLRLVIRETLNGNGATLKEYRIGTEVFDKDDSFDPRLDPIVRNEARRLRRKLEIYYLTEGKTAPLLIELPKGAYSPVFTARAPRIGSAAVLGASATQRVRLILIIGGSLAAALAGWALIPHNRVGSGAAPPSPAAGIMQARAEARERYLYGNRLLSNLRRRDVTASRSELEAAVRSDPGFSEPYAALALNYQVSAQFGLVSHELAMKKSVEFCGKAVELAPNSAATEFALGAHDALLKGDYTAGERHFQRSLALDPNQAVARAIYAVTCLLPLGQAQKAQQEARKAYASDPVSQITAYAAVLTDYCVRDYGAAIASAHKALQLEPDSETIPPLLIESYLFSRSFDEAWFYVERHGLDRGSMGDLYRARIRALRGNRDDALRLARRWGDARADPLLVAELFAAAGNVPSTIRYLGEADRQYHSLARVFARYAPAFDSIRSASGFDALFAK